ncbi:uncharacterized protein LOC102468996 [Tupaia chinensis]|uniref:uncharacterized protein LOC102468996 n=1 Tax=Tupaia chinensis TaxID=246437 RepID=UPI0003C8DF74|nr:uncharacterized protein LOC102468996 [Tupaia chinensis]
MKRYLVVESASKSPLLEEEHLLQKDTAKIQYIKGSNWETKATLGALPSHSLGNKICFSMQHVSEACLCGCSLRTKAILHPRPPPASRPASRVLSSLSSGMKQMSAPVAVFKAQVSSSSPRPKAQAQAQLLSWDKSRASRSALPLRKLVPMGVWPKRCISPLSKALPGEALHTYMHTEGSHMPSLGAISPAISLVEDDNSSLPPLFK